MSGISLFPHQREAIRKMKNGCILNGGVGSGKSRTALAYYYFLNGGNLDTEEYIPMNDPPMDLYIITTAHKRDKLDWVEEMVPFLISVDPETRMYDHNVIVDSWNNIGKYETASDAFFIFDEQRVVGSGSWVKSFLKITRHNKWILLSATPGDNWMDYIPVFIANGFYRNRTEFIREHVVYKRFAKFPMVDRYINTGRLVRLRNKILVNMPCERRTKPEHVDIFVGFDKKLYKDVCKMRWNPWTDEPIKTAGEFCYALRQVVNRDMSRLYAISDVVKNRKRAIIFYNFDYELEMLKEHFAGSLPVAEWNGHKHQPIPDGDQWLYLVQYAAGAEGWNCILTDTIIFYSQNYSYKVMVQASGRIDRLNTPFEKLYYYHLKSRAGIDLAIDKALKEKKKFNEGTFYSGYRDAG